MAQQTSRKRKNAALNWSCSAVSGGIAGVIVSIKIAEESQKWIWNGNRSIVERFAGWPILIANGILGTGWRFLLAIGRPLYLSPIVAAAVISLLTPFAAVLYSCFEPAPSKGGTLGAK